MGDSSASPSCTTRIASTAARAAASLSRKPAGAGSQRAEDVFVEVEGREHEHARRPARSRRRSAGVASTPSMFGHADVHQDDVGRADWRHAVDRFERRRRASPTTSSSGCVSRNSRKPRADERLVVDEQGRGCSRVGRQAGEGRAATRKPPLAARPGFELAAEQRGPLAHADQPVAGHDGILVACRRSRRRRPRGRRSRVAVGDASRDAVARRACWSTFVSASCTIR